MSPVDERGGFPVQRGRNLQRDLREWLRSGIAQRESRASGELGACRRETQVQIVSGDGNGGAVGVGELRPGGPVSRGRGCCLRGSGWCWRCLRFRTLVFRRGRVSVSFEEHFAGRRRWSCRLRSGFLREGGGGEREEQNEFEDVGQSGLRGICDGTGEIQGSFDCAATRLRSG